MYPANAGSSSEAMFKATLSCASEKVVVDGKLRSEVRLDVDARGEWRVC